MRVFDIYKQAFDKRIKSFENKKLNDRILIKKSININYHQWVFPKIKTEVKISHWYHPRNKAF